MLPLLAVCWAFPALAQTLTEPETPTQPESTAKGKSTPLPSTDRFLELSVDKDQSATALVVWKTATALEASAIERKFSFEWVKVPTGATHFQIWSDLTRKEFNDVDFISLNHDWKHTYVSIRNVRPDGTFPEIIKSLADTENGKEKDMIREALRIDSLPAEGGWVYVGSWNESTHSWNSVYWAVAEGSEKLSTRKRLNIRPPEKILGTEAVLDFPLALRTGPSTAFPQLQEGVMLSPGRPFKIVEISRIAASTNHEVWGKIVESTKLNNQ